MEEEMKIKQEICEVSIKTEETDDYNDADANFNSDADANSNSDAYAVANAVAYAVGNSDANAAAKAATNAAANAVAYAVGKPAATPAANAAAVKFSDEPMEVNPWAVDSLGKFLFYNCPECDFKAKDEPSFQNHAVELHYQVHYSIDI
jgi:hypothetical protein